VGVSHVGQRENRWEKNGPLNCLALDGAPLTATKHYSRVCRTRVQQQHTLPFSRSAAAQGTTSLCATQEHCAYIQSAGIRGAVLTLSGSPEHGRNTPIAAQTMTKQDTVRSCIRQQYEVWIKKGTVLTLSGRTKCGCRLLATASVRPTSCHTPPPIIK
jgi:hypothetical protein